MSAPAQADLGADLGALLEGIARLDLFTIGMSPTARFAVDNSERHLHDHMRWLRDGQDAGWLFLCGPVDWDDDWDGTGLAVVRAASIDDAVTLAESEPYHRSGLRQNVVRRWTVNEGTLTVRVDLLGRRGAVS